MARVAAVRTLDQVRVIAWLRWRLFVNVLRSPAAKAELVARGIIAVLAVAFTGLICFGLGAGAYTIMTLRPQAMGALVGGVFLAGQALPLMISAAGTGFDTRSLLRFPLRFSSFVILALSYCVFDPAALSSLLWLASVGAGASAARPEIAHWIFSAIGMLALLSLLLNRLILLWAERLMARRRSREMVFLAFIFSMLSIQLLVGGAQRFGEHLRPLLEPALKVLSILPPGLASGAVLTAETAPAAAAMLLTALALWIGMVGWWLRKRLLARYRGEELAEAVTSRAQETAVAQDESAGRPLLPFFTEQRAALVQKEWRYLFRNAVTMLQLCIPFFLIAFFGLMMGGKNDELGFFERRPETILPSAVAYAIFISLPMAHNALAFESWGLQLLLLAPVRFREVFIAKNLALGTAIYAQGLLVFVLVQGLVGQQRPVIVVSTFVALLFMLLLNFSIGNFLSVYFARAFDFGSFGQRQSPWSVLSGVLTQLVGMAMVYLVYAIAVWCGNPWYAVAGYAVMSAAMFQVYLLTLERVDELAVERREKLIAEICRS